MDVKWFGFILYKNNTFGVGQYHLFDLLKGMLYFYLYIFFTAAVSLMLCVPLIYQASMYNTLPDIMDNRTTPHGWLSKQKFLLKYSYTRFFLQRINVAIFQWSNL